MNPAGFMAGARVRVTGVRVPGVFLCVILAAFLSCGRANAEPPPWNVVLILTDDQASETVEDMPLLLKRIAEQGVFFRNAIVTNPACAPARASILSGGFASKHTGVKTNSALNGGLRNFDESRTLATGLSDSGYATGFVGKYLHGYQPGQVPPGWTRFVANEQGGMIEDYRTVRNVTYGQSAGGRSGSQVRFSDRPKRQYMTEFQTDEAIRFIEDHHKGPFFSLAQLLRAASRVHPGDRR